MEYIQIVIGSKGKDMVNRIDADNRSVGLLEVEMNYLGIAFGNNASSEFVEVVFGISFDFVNPFAADAFAIGR